MGTEVKLNQDCRSYRAHLADLLFDKNYAAAYPKLAAHGASCGPCQAELADLQRTFALLDEYTAPEPSAYFDSRLHARLREAQADPPGSFWERTRAFLQFSTGRSFRPALSGALATVLLLATGGAAVELRQMHSGGTPEASSAVNDLKVLDNNEQAEQQMGQLLDQSGSEDGDTQPTS